MGEEEEVANASCIMLLKVSDSPTVHSRLPTATNYISEFSLLRISHLKKKSVSGLWKVNGKRNDQLALQIETILEVTIPIVKNVKANYNFIKFGLQHYTKRLVPGSEN